MMVVNGFRAGLREWRWSLARQPKHRLRALWWMVRAVLERYGHVPPSALPARHSDRPVPALPSSAEPVASIIVPVFNQAALTRDCLQAIARAGADRPFEVIVVDDGSTDPRLHELRATAGVDWLRSDRNRGFIASCNAGAERARGAALVFLNNDTEVAPGWLDRLLETLQQPGVGLVGACLRYPDGALQEAGGLVFADGSACNYGRLGHPHDPRYRHRRAADYCSGAAIAIPRALFERLGGFDVRYAPAYYEDTDLAMAVRAAGLRVVYEPAAIVVHREGASAGTDITSGMKAHQPVNMRRFRAKWGESLAAMHLRTGVDPDVATRHGHKRFTLTCGNDDGQSEPLWAWLLALAGHGCLIDLHLCGGWDDTTVSPLREAGICVWTQDWLAGARWHWWRTAGGMLLDDGSDAGRAWADRLARDAAPQVRGPLPADLRSWRGDRWAIPVPASVDVPSAVAQMLRALEQGRPCAQARSATT